MKKLIALIAVLILIFTFVLGNMAYADPVTLTMEMLVPSIYGVAQSIGYQFMFPSGYDVDQVSDFLQGKVAEYNGNRSFVSVWGTTPVRSFAGKLAIGQVLYDKIIKFLDYFKGDSKTGYIIYEGYGNLPILFIPANQESNYPLSRVKQNALPVYSGEFGDVKIDVSEGKARLLINDEVATSANYDESAAWYFWTSQYADRYKVAYVYAPTAINNSSYTGKRYLTVVNGTNTKVGDNEEAIDVLPGYAWEGDIGEAPDTNLDQLLGEILDQTLSGDINIDVGVIPDQPGPVPTYEPVEPGDIDGYWNRQADQMQGLGQDINNLDGTISSQTDAITSAQEGTTEAVESLTETIEGVIDSPSSEDLPDFKFDLRELFPFCIPFDIYRLLSSFDAEPQAPHVQIPIVIDSINFRYNLDLDFSAWNPVAQAMRTAELIVYAIALAWATGKVIKW